MEGYSCNGQDRQIRAWEGYRGGGMEGISAGNTGNRSGAQQSVGHGHSSSRATDGYSSGRGRGWTDPVQLPHSYGPAERSSVAGRGAGAGVGSVQAGVPYPVRGGWSPSPADNGQGYGYGGPAGSGAARVTGGRMGRIYGGPAVSGAEWVRSGPVSRERTVTTTISLDSPSVSETLDVTITNEAHSVDHWINSLSRTTARPVTLGFDVEWRPNFQSGEDNPVATLQLACENRCLIVQLIHMVGGESAALRQLLLSPHSTFVGVGVKRDMKKLEEDHGYVCRGAVVELGVLAARLYNDRSLTGAGLKGLGERVLSYTLMKPRNVTMSMWDSEVLSERQIRYAAFDAWMSFLIWKQMNSMRL